MSSTSSGSSSTISQNRPYQVERGTLLVNRKRIVYDEYRAIGVMAQKLNAIPNKPIRIAILLHGLFSYSYSWSQLAPLLIAQDFDVIVAPDLYGWGYSDKPVTRSERQQCTLRRCTRYFVSFLHKWYGMNGLAVAASLTWFGWSYGCCIALDSWHLLDRRSRSTRLAIPLRQTYSALKPKLVILLAPVYPGGLPSWTKLVTGVLSVAAMSPTILDGLATSARQIPALSKWYMDFAFGQPVSDDMFHAYRQALERPGSLVMDAAVLGTLAKDVERVWTQLTHITSDASQSSQSRPSNNASGPSSGYAMPPILVISAGQDRLIDNSRGIAEAFARLPCSTTVVEFSKAGHGLVQYLHASIAKVVHQWIEQQQQQYNK